MINKINFFRTKKGFSLIELSIVLLIIGLLVAGVAGGQKLISLSNLSKARALTNSSPVNGMENLVLWFETTSKNSFSIAAPADGTTISLWNDINPQLTAKKNLITTSVGQPTYKANKINGLPAIVYNNDSCLATSSIPSSQISSDGQMTIFLVGGNFTSDSTDIIIGYDDNGSFGPCCTNPRLGYIELSTTINARFENTNGTTELASNGTLSKNFIMTAIQDPATKYIYMNGALDNSSSSAFGPYFAFNSRWFLGCWSDVTGYLSAGNIGEVIIFDRALSSFERQEVEKYLSKKWGIKLT